MATPKKYLFAVQKSTGHELVSAYIETANVSEVAAEVQEDGRVAIKRGDEILYLSTDKVDDDNVALLRWDADDKLATPRKTAAKRVGEKPADKPAPRKRAAAKKATAK